MQAEVCPLPRPPAGVRCFSLSGVHSSLLRNEARAKQGLQIMVSFISLNSKNVTIKVILSNPEH